MIIVRTPLRISFLGGGSDFSDFYLRHGGCVLSTAIDKFVYVIIKERFDDQIYVNYSKKEIVSQVNDLQHELAREAMRMAGVTQGVEITTLADVPSSGTGLGSSSSVTVGMLRALYAHKGFLLTAETLAEQACEIEIEICGKPIGKQDQYIAAYGGIRQISFNRGGDIKVEYVNMDEDIRQNLNRRLMLFYTNHTRAASTVLDEQRDNIPDRTELLSGLRDLALRGRECLESGDLNDLGHMMHEGWEMKKGLASGVSNLELDELYAAALRAGALGGKIAGAGGGGFLLLFCPLGAQEAVRAELSNLRELPFSLERDGCCVIFNGR